MKRTSRIEIKNFLRISMILLLEGSIGSCQNEKSQVDITAALLPSPRKSGQDHVWNRYSLRCSCLQDLLPLS